MLGDWWWKWLDAEFCVRSKDGHFSNSCAAACLKFMFHVTKKTSYLRTIHFLRERSNATSMWCTSSTFHKLQQWHFTGDVDIFIIAYTLCEFSSGFCVQKLFNSVDFSREFLRHNVDIITSGVCIFHLVEIIFCYSVALLFVITLLLHYFCYSH